MFATPTVAGIVEKDGQRVVQGTRRPDGTSVPPSLPPSFPSLPFLPSLLPSPTDAPSLDSYRKELKIRPGFTPEEDVSRYRTTRAAEQLAREAVKGRIPGLGVGGNNSAVQAALTGMSKAQKKNVKRKEKRKEGEPESEDEEGGKAKVEEVVDDWDAEEEEGGEGGKGENEGKKEVVVVVAPPPPPPVVEDSKRVKALKKKLRQVRSLLSRSRTG